jgi:hypothetical protein
MDYFDILLPFILLLFASLLKLAIDQAIDNTNSIEALCELPVDMQFLAISVLIVYLTSNSPDIRKGLSYCLAYFILAVLAVIIWRKSVKMFENKNNWFIALLVINFAFAFVELLQSTRILLHKDISQIETPKK